jgi:enamine deaminase RidA (YjgF/YER057c/UK114 family)
MSTEHEIVISPELAEPIGYAHAVVAAPGRTVHLGGQTAMDETGRIVGTTFAEQFEVALRNLVAAMRAAGCAPADLVSLQIFVTDVAEYRASLRELAPIWRAALGRRYPAMGAFGVTALFDPDAKVELMAVAVRPD